MESIKSKFPRQGEIWLIDYTFKFSELSKELEVESQIKKLRPSIILSNDIQNEFNNRIIVAPLTSKEVEVVNSPFEILIKQNELNKLDKNSKVLLNFLLSVDKNHRLVKYVGKLDGFELERVLNGVNIIFKKY